VQLTPLARLLGWARSTRQNASACWCDDIPQPSDVRGTPRLLPLYRSAARALPGTCLSPASSTLHTPASGAVEAQRSAAPIALYAAQPAPYCLEERYFNLYVLQAACTTLTCVLPYCLWYARSDKRNTQEETAQWKIAQHILFQR